MIEEIVTGVLTDAIAATGRLLVSAVPRPGGRRTATNLEIARWFDTYRLTEQPQSLPELSSTVSAQLAQALRGDDIQAVLHELLATRLTDAPEVEINRIRTIFELTLDAFGPEVSKFSLPIFDYYDTEICDLVGDLQGSHPALLSQIKNEAMSARMIAILHAIDHHISALTKGPDPTTEDSFLARYRRHLIEHHGKIEPPDFERRRRVPIKDLYVSPTIVQRIGTQDGWLENEINLWTLAKEIDRTVLLGDPGGGKTTAANAIVSHFANGRRHVPFLVTLREFASSMPPERSVVAHIEHKLETFYQCSYPAYLVSKLLSTGRALVIFDGLDELIDTSHRSEVTAVIERFATEYPLTRILVTSRVVGYDQARLDDQQFVPYRITRFTDSQVGDYVHKWFAQEEGIEAAEIERWANAFIDESSANRDLRANPLMLSLMCILYRGVGSLPRDRSEVYEQCANLLFRKWDARRRIYIDLSAGHLLEPTLRHIAWWLFDRRNAQSAVTEREIIKKTTEIFLQSGFESESDAQDAASQFVSFCKGRMWVFSDVGTTATGEILYSFTHRTFLEYFAAAHLAFSSDTAEQLARRLAPHIARNEWEVTGELAVQIKDRTSDRGAQRIYAILMNERRRRSVSGRSGILQFLSRCLRSVDPPPPTIRALTEMVFDHLLEGDLNDRARYLPLSWLLGSCFTCKEIVNDVINSRIEVMIGSEDPTMKLNGLRLAILFYWGAISGGDAGPQLSPENPLAKFWKKRSEEKVSTYATLIRHHAFDAPALMHCCLRNNFLTIDQVLTRPEGLKPLFRDASFGVYSISWQAYLPVLVRSLATRSIDSRSDETAEFRTVGRYLSGRTPPWMEWPATEDMNFYVGDPPDQPVDRTDIDEVAYLGAAASLFIIFEITNKKELCEQDINWFGPLGKLRSYIRRRQYPKTKISLSDLPVPIEFRKLFRDWAYGKVDLVRRSS